VSAPAGPLPRWIEIGVMPIINLLLALVVTGLIVLAIGENPFTAIGTMAGGAFGDLYGIGYTSASASWRSASITPCPPGRSSSSASWRRRCSAPAGP
jgi:hypothetical protein